MYAHTIPEKELTAMKAMLASADLIPSAPGLVGSGEQQTRAQHVQHCLEQVLRFARLFEAEDPAEHWRRVAQMPMNFGRAQELLGSIGGIDLWWTPFSMHWEARDWDQIALMASEYLKQLGLSAKN